MDQSILDYLKTQRVCVLSVEMIDGAPHAATVHFAHAESPLVFFFETNRDYRKAEPLLTRPSVRASVVIGSNEGDMRTLQMDGAARMVTPAEQDIFRDIYLGKFPAKEKNSTDPRVIPFMFTPAWWRFTDWTRPEGKRIFSSGN